MIWYERKSWAPSSHRPGCTDDGFSFVVLFVRFDSEFLDETRSQCRQSIANYVW